MAAPSPAVARTGIAVVFFLNGLGYGSWAPRIAEIQRDLGLGDGHLGLALLMVAIGALLAMALAGALAGRHGSRPVTLVAALAYALTLGGLAFAQDFASLAAALFLHGAAAGALDVAMNAQGVAVEARLGRPVLSSLHGMFSLGGMAGAALAGGLASAAVARPTHLVAVGALIAIGSCLGYRRLLAGDRARRRGGPRFALPDRGLLALGVIALCGLLAEGAVGDWSAVYVSGTLGAPTALAAAAFAVFSLAMALGRLVGDRLVALLGGVRVLRLGGSLAAVGLASTLLTGQPALAVVGFGLVGAGLACVFPVVVSAAARTSNQAAGPAIAAVCTLGYLGFLIGPPAIGGLAELFGLPMALAAVVALLAMISLLARRVR